MSTLKKGVVPVEWAGKVSSTFQDLEFDGSSSILFITGLVLQ